MACNHQRSEQIADFSAGHLRGDLVDNLLDHLDGCEPCSQEFDLAADLATLGAPVAELRPVATPDPVRRRPLLRMVLPAAAAAALLLTIVGRGSDPPVSSLASLEALHYPTSVLRGGDDDLRRAAMERYQAGDFERAAAELGALAQENDQDALAHFYGGLALLQLDRMTDAQTALTAAVAASEGLLRERALWYLANTELALEQGQRAQTTLERLIGLDGEYVLDARAKLDALRPLLDDSPE